MWYRKSTHIESWRIFYDSVDNHPNPWALAIKAVRSSLTLYVLYPSLSHSPHPHSPDKISTQRLSDPSGGWHKLTFILAFLVWIFSITSFRLIVAYHCSQSGSSQVKDPLNSVGLICERGLPCLGLRPHPPVTVNGTCLLNGSAIFSIQPQMDVYQFIFPHIFKETQLINWVSKGKK